MCDIVDFELFVPKPHARTDKFSSVRRFVWSCLRLHLVFILQIVISLEFREARAMIMATL